MADYAVDLVRATASTALAIGAVENPAASPKRIKVYDIIWGYPGTPADASAELEIQRATTSGTATAVVPVALDPADPAAGTVAEENHTVQGTITANTFLGRFAMNQRTTFRWVAREGKEMVIPAVNNNGLHFNTPTTPAVAVSLTVHFTE